MNLFGLNISLARTSRSTFRAPNAQRSLSSPQAWLAGADLPPAASPLVSPYEQVAWVYRAINALAEQVANIPFLFSCGERGRENLITSGPLLDFYDQPHPQLDRFQYWELRVLWLMLRGECFRVPIYEIVENHQLIGWRYTGFPRSTPLEAQVFLPEEVWFEKLPNPFNFWRGLSPLAVAGLAAKTDFAAASFMRGFIENNADNGLIVRTDEHLDDPQKEQLVAALNNRKRSAGAADRPLLLWSTCEIVKPTLSAADFQFLENRKFSRSEICAAFGVPEEIVSSTDHNKYDVMQGARLNFVENRIAPLCARLEAHENHTTIPALCAGLGASAYPSENQKTKTKNLPVGWFDLDSLPIMQTARRIRLAAAKTGFDMGIPFNDLNRVLDLGFQPLPWGDTGYLPKTLVPLLRSPRVPPASPGAVPPAPASLSFP